MSAEVSKTPVKSASSWLMAPLADAWISVAPVACRMCAALAGVTPLPGMMLVRPSACCTSWRRRGKACSALGACPEVRRRWYLSNWKDEAAGSEFENISDLSNVIDNDEGVLKTRTFKAPAFFNNTLYEDYFGTIWLQKEFYLSEKHAKYGAKLYLGTLVDFDDTYVNGVKVGHTDYRYPQRRYGIKEGTLKPGKNTVTVRPGLIVKNICR